MSVLRHVLLGALAVAMLTGLGADGAPPASPKVPAERPTAPTPDQQVAELVEACRALPPEAKLGVEGDRLLERLHMVRGKLLPRSQEAVARLEASQTLRRLAQALQKNDRESLKDLVSKQSEREILACGSRRSCPTSSQRPEGGSTKSSPSPPSRSSAKVNWPPVWVNSGRTAGSWSGSRRAASCSRDRSKTAARPHHPLP